MLKEIHEQPVAIADTLEGRINRGRVLEASFGPEASEIFDAVKSVQIIACGTSPQISPEELKKAAPHDITFVRSKSYVM